jgi:hypothetical protein
LQLRRHRFILGELNIYKITSWARAGFINVVEGTKVSYEEAANRCKTTSAGSFRILDPAACRWTMSANRLV